MICGTYSFSFSLSLILQLRTQESQTINPRAPEGNQPANRKEEKEKGTKRLSIKENQRNTTGNNNEIQRIPLTFISLDCKQTAKATSVTTVTCASYATGMKVPINVRKKSIA